MDVLGKGSVIGQYSALFGEEVIFGAYANSPTGTTLMCLDRDALDTMRNRAIAFDASVLQVEEEVEESGVP